MSDKQYWLIFRAEASSDSVLRFSLQDNQGDEVGEIGFNLDAQLSPAQVVGEVCFWNGEGRKKANEVKHPAPARKTTVYDRIQREELRWKPHKPKVKMEPIELRLV